MSDESVPVRVNEAVQQRHVGSAGLPTSQPVLRRALRFEIAATGGLIIIFAGLGYVLSRTPGLIGGVFGVTLAGVLSCITIASILFANSRFIRSPNFVVIFFGIVAGGWLLKLLSFIIAVVLLRGQSWLDTKMLFFGLVSGIVLSLLIDALVVVRARVPHVDVHGTSSHAAS